MKKTTLIILCAMVLMAGCKTEESAVNNSSEPLQSSAYETETAKVSEISHTEPEVKTDSEYIIYNWKFDEPENHGVDSKILENFHSALENIEIRSSVIVKDGYIIDEYYKDGYDENSVFGLASCTKSFSGALIGIAVDKGIIDSVDDKIADYFPQLSADKQDITIEHLLTHSSGIYWNEWSGGDYFRQLSRSENWVDFILGQDMASTPGKVFNYTTGGSHLLGAVIQEAAGITECEFGTENLFKPLGMESVKWRSDPQGITDGGNGISMTARDAAKFGQLYLNGGSWEGEQIISDEWVKLSTERQAAGSPGTGEYGYSWWLKQFGGYDVYYAMGHGGQYIFVVPEINLVTVMTSRLNDTYVPQYYFNDYVIAACRA